MIGLGLSLSFRARLMGGVVIPPDALRVAEIEAAPNGTAVVPQSYYDAMAVEAADPNTHPSLGTADVTAVKDGVWSDPTLWDTGIVPTEGQKVNTSTFDVTYDIESNVKIASIHVSGAGTFRWATNMDTRLWVGTLMCHGTYVHGTYDDPILNSTTNGKPRSEIVFWANEAPLATVKCGLITMGQVRMHGQEKLERTTIADVLAGASTIVLDDAPSNWRVGDTLVVVATTYAGTAGSDAQYEGPASAYLPIGNSYGVRTASTFQLSHDEIRTITAIAGNTLTVNAPFTYNHTATTRTLPHGETYTVKHVVAMLSHSIRMRTADASDSAIWASADLTDLQKRGHVMFMHTDGGDVRYVETKNMGRTDTNPTLVAPAATGTPGGETVIRATSGGTILTDTNNVRGRYPLHIHGTGPFFGRKQFVLKGCSAWAPTSEYPIPGWAITHHNSRAAIEGCTVYNVRGAGIVSELGNEIGQWIDNTVCWARGDGYGWSWGTRAENYQNHNGHQGAAYENQARQVLCQGNIASSAAQSWAYMQQDVAWLARVPDILSIRYFDELTSGAALSGVGQAFTDDNDTAGIEQAQIPDFNDNVSFGCRTGFTVAHRQFTERNDGSPMIGKRNHCIACYRAFDLVNYSYNYWFYDFIWTGTGTSNGYGYSGGTISWGFNFVNGHVENFVSGFVDAGQGLNYLGNWIDISFVDVTNEFVQGSYQHTGSTDPTAHPYYDLYEPGSFVATAINTPVGGYTFRPRTWFALDSTTDLPWAYPAAPIGAVDPGQPDVVPYFVMNPGPDLTITPGGLNTVSFSGVIVDGVGARIYPSHGSWSGTTLVASTIDAGPRTNINTTGVELVGWRGCYLDGATWKTRIHILDGDRLTGEHLVIPIDITLTGFDSGFLTANDLGGPPDPPVLPLLPEAIPDRPLIADTTAPTITSSVSLTRAEGEVFAHVLQADDVDPRFTIVGGADAALFEIVRASGVSTLRLIGGPVLDFEAPADAGGNNVYNVEITARDAVGNTSASVAHVLTVTDVFDAVVNPFTDTFARANENLEASVFWTRSGGFTGIASIVSSNDLRTNGTAAGDLAVYRTPDTGSLNHYVEGEGRQGFNNCALGVSITDQNNWISARQSNSSTVTVSKRVAGVTSTVTTFASTFVANQSIRAEWDQATNTLTVKKAGVSIGSIVVTSPPPATTRAGIVITGTGQSPVYNNINTGAL